MKEKMWIYCKSSFKVCLSLSKENFFSSISVSSLITDADSGLLQRLVQMTLGEKVDNLHR
jgi:hypothetical protein